MVKSKKLIKKSEKSLEKLWDITKCNWLIDLQFEKQNMEVKKSLYASIDYLKRFIDNIDVE